MATLNDGVYDLGLNVLDTEANVLHINSLETSTYAQTTSNSLGNKTSLSVGAPADGAVSGRRVTVAAITDGAVTSTGTVAFYSLVDSSNVRLLATGALSSSQSVTSANTFTLDAFDIEIPDPA